MDETSVEVWEIILQSYYISLTVCLDIKNIYINVGMSIINYLYKYYYGSATYYFVHIGHRPFDLLIT